ncbi:DUF1641 domain-containing protein [Fervidicoccus fontis]|jgi:uncharacterized protein YjgD (DUF1641 family)|nr:DUF1641 domain-containing protein [Fervidicoccus fontis]MBE9391207.1 DUF1641 domain-containing protein [Fervidicoccus fontis]
MVEMETKELSEKEEQELLKLLQNPELVESLNKTLSLLINLNKTGLLDMLNAIVNEDFIASLMKLIMTPEFLRLMDSINDLMAVLQQVTDVMIEKEEKKTGLTGLMRAFSDPDVQLAATKLVKILKVIGSYQKK